LSKETVMDSIRAVGIVTAMARYPSWQEAK